MSLLFKIKTSRKQITFMSNIIVNVWCNNKIYLNNRYLLRIIKKNIINTCTS